MRVIYGDLWQIDGFHVVPTNLTTRRDGTAIMGRGVAKQATLRYPTLESDYGQFLQGQQTCLSSRQAASLYLDLDQRLICLPVKRHWADRADLALIASGVQQLAALPARNAPVVFPLLGCGFGERSPRDVLPLLETFLHEERFILVLRDDVATRRHAATLRPGACVDQAALRDLARLQSTPERRRLTQVLPCTVAPECERLPPTEWKEG